MASQTQTVHLNQASLLFVMLMISRICAALVGAQLEAGAQFEACVYISSCIDEGESGWGK